MFNADAVHSDGAIAITRGLTRGRAEASQGDTALPRVGRHRAEPDLDKGHPVYDLSLVDDDEDFSNDPIAIRPFVLTGGRTASTVPFDALATARTDIEALTISLTIEQERIIRLCRMPRAVAEISARVGLPLGVTRVLVGDLETMGIVHISQTTDTNDDLAVIGRLIEGLLLL
ncbi:MAG: DUF742 domain-containing protein [Actinomycetota bacterium]